ncbi:hypothetical protein C4K40_3006 [Pseudomonas sp. CMR5c]|nr:hypothetical protein C4K40_3006 [Pseudomonas sp. CMR5c]
MILRCLYITIWKHWPDLHAMTSFNTHDIARLAKVATLCGFDMDALLAEIGVFASACSGSDGSWDAEALGRLYAAGLKLSLQDHFPFVLGELFLFDRIPEADIFLATSATLQEALSILCYLPFLLQPDTLIWTEVHGDELHIFSELQQSGLRLANPGFIETVFVVIWRLIRQVAPFSDIKSLCFRHESLQSATHYSRQFGSAPIFAASFNRLTLASDCLLQPLCGASPGLHAQARLLLEKRVQRQGLRGRLEQVVEVMVKQHPATSLLDVCERLGLEPRSLQRRLKEEGVTFNEVHARSRFYMARLLLSDPGIDIESIAEKLGFADRHSFSRSFSKWAGISPSRYRIQG